MRSSVVFESVSGRSSAWFVTNSVEDSGGASERGKDSSGLSDRSRRQRTLLEQQVVLNPLLLEQLEPAARRRVDRRQAHACIGPTLLLLADTSRQRRLPLLLLLLLWPGRGGCERQVSTRQAQDGWSAASSRQHARQGRLIDTPSLQLAGDQNSSRRPTGLVGGRRALAGARVSRRTFSSAFFLSSAPSGAMPPSEFPFMTGGGRYRQHAELQTVDRGILSLTMLAGWLRWGCGSGGVGWGWVACDEGALHLAQWSRRRGRPRHARRRCSMRTDGVAPTPFLLILPSGLRQPSLTDLPDPR